MVKYTQWILNDILVLQGLGLLINMVEHCDGNRIAVLKSKTGKPFELYNPLNNLIDTLDALTMVSISSNVRMS